ncbi:MAG: ABC transporter permease subunit, partial [Spirochaetaceae bacterium]|nr:ABC transporter permease subunit [Spirochaetaceae bacterium]
LNQLMVPFMIIMVITFFRTIPEELYESARMDGANDFQLFSKIALPLSMAIMVTIFLMQAVAYWNVFLQAKLFLLDTYLYPIQLFISSIMKGGGDALQGSMNSRDPFAESESTKSALTIMASIPICVLYLFLQKYFTKGIMEGSIKG